LRKALVEEQGYICCFCNKAIDYQQNGNIDIAEIEHLKSQHDFPEWQLAYENLVASCAGDRTEPPKRQIHCNAAKGQKSITVMPTLPDCENRFAFTDDGMVYGRDTDANETIDILNINHFKLIENRKSQISAWLFDTFEYLDGKIIGKYISLAVAQQKFERLQQRQNNRFEPYYSAIHYSFKNVFNL